MIIDLLDNGCGDKIQLMPHVWVKQEHDVHRLARIPLLVNGCYLESQLNLSPASREMFRPCTTDCPSQIWFWMLAGLTKKTYNRRVWNPLTESKRTYAEKDLSRQPSVHNARKYSKSTPTFEIALAHRSRPGGYISDSWIRFADEFLHDNGMWRQSKMPCASELKVKERCFTAEWSPILHTPRFSGKPLLAVQYILLGAEDQNDFPWPFIRRWDLQRNTGHNRGNGTSQG